MDYKKSNAPASTITRNMNEIEDKTGNVYESLMIMSKRANQISNELKQELNNKLEEFSSYSDNLEEIFENREQIEISRFYERLPKPSLMASEEFMDEKVYYRNPKQNKDKSSSLKFE